MNPVNPKVAIILLNLNRKADTLECLDSIARMTYPSWFIVLVDNGSTDGSIEAIGSWSNKNKPVAQIQNSENLGFSAGCNKGITEALRTGADYVFLLNNDTVVAPDALTLLVERAESDRRIGMTGPKIYQYGKHRVLDSAGTRAIPWLAQAFLIGHGEEDHGQFDAVAVMPYITGTALLIKRQELQDLGLLDEDYFVYFEDFDLGLRAMQAGMLSVFEPKALIYHKGSQTAGFGSPFYLYHSIRSRILFARKHIPNLPFLMAFLPYLFLYRYLRLIILLATSRKWAHASALHSGLCEGFRTPISSCGPVQETK